MEEDKDSSNDIVWGHCEFVMDSDDEEYTYQQLRAFRGLQRRHRYNILPEVTISDHYDSYIEGVKERIKTAKSNIDAYNKEYDVLHDKLKSKEVLIAHICKIDIFDTMDIDDIDRNIELIKKSLKKYIRQLDELILDVIKFLHLRKKIQLTNREFVTLEQAKTLSFLEYRNIVKKMMLTIRFEVGANAACYEFGNGIGQILLNRVDVNTNARLKGLGKMLNMIDPDYQYYQFVWRKTILNRKRMKFKQYLWSEYSIKECIRNNFTLQDIRWAKVPFSRIANFSTKLDKSNIIKYIRTNEQEDYKRRASFRGIGK